MGCGSTNEKSPKSNSFSYCFNESEISSINELKKEKDEENVAADSFSILYKKLVTDLTKKEQIFKEYIVLYVPSNYNKESIIYDYEPMITSLDFESKEDDKLLKYLKKNNNSRDIVNFEIKKEETEYRTLYLTKLEFKVTQEDKEKNLITIEACYNIKLLECYGIYKLYYTFEMEICESNSFLLSINDDYTIEERNGETFTKISNNEFYSTNNQSISILLRKGKLKINIENEIDKKLLSKFSSDEIKQINFSLDKIKFYPSKKYLLYHKIIHNIKDNKDNMKMYYLIFYPHFIGSSSTGEEGEGAEGEGGEGDGPISYPIIIKEFKINNMLVKKYENYEEIPKNQNIYYKFKSNLSDEKIHGYYISTIDQFSLNYNYTGTFGLYELDCESTFTGVSFKLNYNHLLEFNLDIGSSFKYEIILNGNKIKFSNSDFQYKINKDKIIFDGCIDEYDEKKYIEMEKEKDPDYDINDDSENYRHYKWKREREEKLIPSSMEIVE